MPFLWNSDNETILLLSTVPPWQFSKHWRHPSEHFPTAKTCFLSQLPQSPNKQGHTGAAIQAGEPTKQEKGAVWRGHSLAREVPRSDPAHGQAGWAGGELGGSQVLTEATSTGKELPWACGDTKNSTRKKRVHYIKMYFPASSGSLVGNTNSGKHPWESTTVLRSQKSWQICPHPAPPQSWGTNEQEMPTFG